MTLTVAPRRPQTKRGRNPRNRNRTLGANTLPGILSVFPQRLYTRLEYVDELTLSTQSTLSTFGSEYAFRLNSLFDPYFPVGGHQPYGFDQLTSIYGRYMVHKCTVEVTFSDPSSDGLVVAAFAKNLNDANTLVNANIAAAMERPTVWCKPVNNTGSQTTVFRKSYDLAQMIGITRSQLENAWPSTSALVSADPLQVCYFIVAAANARGGSTQSITARVRLIFDCQFWERNTVAQS